VREYAYTNERSPNTAIPIQTQIAKLLSASALLQAVRVSIFALALLLLLYQP
jgi:hypothetical protein